MHKEFSSADIVVLAGGKGERMGALAQNRQKCLIPFEGKPILGHVLDSVSEAFGSANVTLCVSFRAEDVYRYVERNKPSNIHTDYALDVGDSQTANIFRALEKRVSVPFIGLAGDILTKSPDVYKRGYEQVLQEGILTSIAVSPDLDVVNTHGVARVENERIKEFNYPPPEAPAIGWYRDMTIWGMGKNFYTYAHEHPEILTVSSLVQLAVTEEEYVGANYYEDSWIHFGSPVDLSKSL